MARPLRVVCVCALACATAGALMKLQPMPASTVATHLQCAWLPVAPSPHESLATRVPCAAEAPSAVQSAASPSPAAAAADSRHVRACARFGSRGVARLLASRVSSSRVCAPLMALRLDATTRLQLCILVGAAVLVQMAVGAVVPVLPALATSLGLSASGVGLIIAMPSLAKLVVNLLVGRWVDVHGQRRVLVLGSLVEGVGSLATACASSLRAIVPARLLVGAGTSAASTAEQAMLMQVAGRYPEHTGLLLGTVHALTMLAFAAGPAVGGLLAERGGSRLPFLAIGCALVAIAPLYTLLPEGGRGSTHAEPKRAVAAALAAYRELLGDRTQRALLALRFSLVAGWAAWLTVIPAHATAVWGAGAGELGRMFSCISLIGMLCAPLGGALADRYGRRGLAFRAGLLSALAVGALPMCVGKRSFYVAMAAWDVGESMMTAASSALAADVTPADQFGAQSSLNNQVQDATFVFMPLALGAMAASSTKRALYVAAAMMAMGVGAFGVMTRPPPAADAAFG